MGLRPTVIVDDGVAIARAADLGICVCCDGRDSVETVRYLFSSEETRVRVLGVPLCNECRSLRTARTSVPGIHRLTTALGFVIALAAAFLDSRSAWPLVLCAAFFASVACFFGRQGRVFDRFPMVPMAPFSLAFVSLRRGEHAVAFGTCGLTKVGAGGPMNFRNLPTLGPCRIFLIRRSNSEEVMAAEGASDSHSEVRDILEASWAFDLVDKKASVLTILKRDLMPWTMWTT